MLYTYIIFHIYFILGANTKAELKDRPHIYIYMYKLYSPIIYAFNSSVNSETEHQASALIDVTVIVV